jgi:mannosylglycerate hydrolase
MTQQNPSRAISAYYHTHWDREWYLPFRAYQVRLTGVVDEILERLETKLLPCFMLDGQTVVLEDYLELRPENRSQLKDMVQAGRLSIGPWFVMPDEFLVSGESLIRNLVRGIREARAWGCHQFTGYLPDTFGHSADIPTLLRHSGIDSAVIWRGIDPKHSLFQWQSPSGNRVKTLHLTDGYFQMMLHDWTATETEKQDALTGLTAKLEAVSLPEAPVLLPIGGDHLAPVTAEGHAMLKTSYPQLEETMPDRFLDSLPETQLETIHGELIENSGSFLLPGVYSSRMYLKQANRKLEHLLTHQLEPLLALAQSLKLPKPFSYPRHELDLAWKTLILNHPHDSICGCSVDAVHRENEVRFDQVQQLGEAMLNRAQAALTDSLASPDAWLVFNTGDTPYTGVVPAVEDVLNAEIAAGKSSQLWQVASEETVLQDEYLHDGHRIPLSHLTQTRRHGWIWAENVPAFGYQKLAKTGAPERLPFKPVELTSDGLHNGLISIQVNPTGTLQVTDLQTSQTYTELLQFHALPDQGDSYNSAPVPGTEPSSAKFLGSKITLKGPLVATLELTHCIESLNLTLTTEVQLQAESPLIRLKTTFTNQTPDYKLQVSFPTGQPITTVVAENHLGLVTRQYDPNYRPLDHMPVEKMKELKTNTGPVQRFFSANGQSWITQGLAEYEVYQDTLSLTLMRAFSHLSKKDTGVRGAQAGPPFATPEGQCLNRTFVCEYAWLPTPTKPNQLYEQAARYYGNVWAVSGTKTKDNIADSAVLEASALFQWEPGTAVTSACYWSPGKGLVLRLLNPVNQPQSVKLTPQFGYRNAVEVNFLEEPIQPISTGILHLGPHDVKTVLFEV